MLIVHYLLDDYVKALNRARVAGDTSNLESADEVPQKRKNTTARQSSISNVGKAAYQFYNSNLHVLRNTTVDQSVTISSFVA